MKQCGKCGASITEGAQFCGNCGAPVSFAESTPLDGGSEMDSIRGRAFSEKDKLEELARPLVRDDGVIASYDSMDPITSEAPKGVKTKMIAMMMFSLLCLAIGIGGVTFAVITRNGEEVAKEEKEKEEVIAAVNGTKVRLNDYELTLTDDYAFEVFNEETGDIIEYTKDMMTYLVGSMYFDKFTFSTVENNVDVIKESLLNGAESVEAGFKTIDDMDFVYFDYHGKNGKNILYAFTEADLYCFMTTLVMKDNTIGTDRLNDVVGVLGSAVKVDPSRRLAGPSNRSGLEAGGQSESSSDSEINMSELNKLMSDAIPEDLE